ncbi:nuclear transport factor 2 family protein [Arthrobacter sp. zg-ZUI100]|uniref:nuclear transport factor 2 family protein n=1 Tax=Arthrobacter jiangjiafuii TaxID=2817475 RepID=UPI001AEE304B|nr:DUF4440 domain-containing protein [Arthrobacter jiangjiafuii]MBP3035458.1 nuclear transport factor 2 family protein [Arthrobacter jiangjiafuii]
MNAHGEIQTAEVELLDSLTRGNEARVQELLHPEFVEIGRSGRRWTRAEIIDSLGREDQRPAPETDEWEFADLAPNIILVTYRLRAGTRQSRHSSVWDMSAGQARLRYHQGTVIPLEFQ